MAEIEPIQPSTPSRPEQQVLTAVDPWDERLALNRVKENFGTAESYRRLNHDWRWKNADELYLGWVQQRYWEGTKLPRSSLSVYLTLEHIESMLPRVITALFGETYWFDARPYPATSIQEARAIQEMILAQARAVNSGTGIRDVVRRAAKSALLYGNGVFHLGWRRGTERKVVTIDELIPITQKVTMGGFTFNAPTGRNSRNVRHVMQDVEVNEPVLEYVPLRDFYIDPNTPSPFPWDASYCVRRKLVPIGKLLQLQGSPEISIPDKDKLMALAMNKTVTAGDEGILFGEAMREGSYNRTDDYSVSGEDKRVEVLEYWTNERLVWVLGRKWVAYNVPNPYDAIPFYNIFYVDVLDRFYSLAMSDVLEPEQRLQQSIINARVDELSLAIHPPTVKRRGIPIPLSQLRRRPGLVTETDNPAEDLQVAEIPNVTRDAFTEVAASESRAQRRDGITELAVLGTTGQGSSVNRTATGIQTLASASFSRIGYFIENVQENCITPMLDRWLLLNKKFNTQQDVVKILGTEGQLIELNPSALIRAQLKFEMRSASKANSKAAMMESMPLLIQTFANPAMLAQLQAMGLTVNIEELYNIVLDATGYRPHKSSLIRQLTPQEIQGIQQGGIDQTKILMQMIRGQSSMETTQESKAADIVKELIRSKAQVEASKNKSRDKEKKDNDD